MNPDMLLDAIGLLDDRHFEAEKKPRITPWRRRLLALAAAVFMVILSVGTAMAVSPEFRELVFRFFHIEQEQIIPDSTVNTELSVEDMFAEPEITIGNVIQGKYIHTPVATHARNGIYLVCTDEVEMRQGSHYDGYYEENGEFIKLEEHTFKQDYVLYGSDIHVEFDWVEHNGSVSMTWADPEVRFRKENQSGDASAALFTFLITWQCDDGTATGTLYPVLLNLHTGELTDILAGTDANRMPGIDKCAISPDRTKLLLGQDAEEGYFLYYADLAAKQIYSVDELSGQHATACSLIGSTLACWSLADDRYTAWKIDLTTLERTELFDSMFHAAATPEADAGIVFMEGFDGWNRWGDMYTGSSFALEVDEAQNVYVIDLTTGTKTQIEGYTWTPDTQRTPSPDGKKLLLAGRPDGQDFEYVGVLDFEHMTFAEFSRENQQDEYLAYWFDGDTVVICAEVSSESMCSDYYQYSLGVPAENVPLPTEAPTEEITETAAPVIQQPAMCPEPDDADFVRIIDYIPTARVELPYATVNNFTGCRVYDFADPYLRYGTLKKLMKVSDELGEQGIGLIIWDGFRPAAAQAKLWEICPDPTFVSHPVTGKRTHCRGNTVDISLYDLETGEDLPVPTGYDNFTSYADRDYSDCSPDAAANARLLEQTMEKHGFTAYFAEWWHFADTVDYPIDEFFDPAIPTTWTANCSEYISLRTAPGGEVVAKIPKGEAMELQGWDGKYAEVSYNGMAGYVLTNYIMPEDDCYFTECLDTVKPTNVYSYEQMLSDIGSLQGQYPDVVSVSSIGTTELGRDIPVLRIGDLNTRYHVLLQGAIHGREHLSAWLLMAMADYWLDHGILGYGDVCYHIIPMTNPDGVIISQTGILNDAQHQIYLSDKESGYTSKTESSYAALWKANGAGVDINRNFPAGWDSVDDRTGPSSQQYQGAKPFSAAEAVALRDYTLKYAFDATVSYHATGSLIYYSYGDKEPVNTQSKSLAGAVREISGYDLSSSNGIDGAGYKDWVMDELAIPSLTIEVGCEEAALAEREIYSIFVRNYRVLPAIARWLQMQ